MNGAKIGFLLTMGGIFFLFVYCFWVSESQFHIKPLHQVIYERLRGSASSQNSTQSTPKVNNNA